MLDLILMTALKICGIVLCFAMVILLIVLIIYIIKGCIEEW